MKKKGLILLVFAFVLLFVTGCGKKTETLTCTTTQEVSGIKIDAEAKMTFVGDVINKLVLTMDINATSDLMKSNWNIIEQTYDKQYAPVEKDGLKVTTKKDASNYKYTIVVDADPAKAQATDLSPYGMSSLAGAKDSLDVTQSGLEAAGYTCKK